MKIKTIDIIHHSHYDLGYTDHPDVASKMHIQFINRALDLVDATKNAAPGEGFSWTIEVQKPFIRWWHYANKAQRKRMLDAIERRQIEVCAFYTNTTAMLSAEQWDWLLSKISNELWESINIQTVMQVDVNGISLAGLIRASSKGVKYLWMSPNSYLGDVPFPLPFIMNWRMPNGKELFTFVSRGYSNAHQLFHDSWRQGLIASADNLCYRPPSEKDIFASDEESVYKSHEICLRNMQILGYDRDKYNYSRLPVSLTNHWRIDNDPPLAQITKFVQKWNLLGLEPKLKLTTPSQALYALKKEAGDNIPSYEGEWTDWWARGTLSTPVELSASRRAKYNLRFIKSSFFKKSQQDNIEDYDKIMEKLCLFDEHTWGGWDSVGYPYSINSRGGWAYKSNLVYSADALASYRLSQKIRMEMRDLAEGIYILNLTGQTLSDRIELPTSCLRGNFDALREEGTGLVRNLEYTPGSDNFVKPVSEDDFSYRNISRTFIDNARGKTVSFWTGDVPPYSYRRYLPIKTYVNKVINADDKKNLVDYHVDNHGWPTSVLYGNEYLISAKQGDFICIAPQGLSPRWAINELYAEKNDFARSKLKNRYMIKTMAKYDKAEITIDSNDMVLIRQRFTHESLCWGERQMKIWKNEPKVQLTIRINRRYSLKPEAFFIAFPLLGKNFGMPITSNGGNIFMVGAGQLPGTCMDHHAIDGWVYYPNNENGKNLLWSSRDCPVVSFGTAHLGDLSKNSGALGDKEDLYAFIFDNTWDTNFAADSHGDMEFVFYITRTDEKPAKICQHADALSMGLIPFVLLR